MAGKPKFPLFQKWPFQKTIGDKKGRDCGTMGGKFGRGSWDQKFEVQKGDQLMLLDQICLFGWVLLGDLGLVYIV